MARCCSPVPQGQRVVPASSRTPTSPHANEPVEVRLRKDFRRHRGARMSNAAIRLWFTLLTLLFAAELHAAADPLPSWNDTAPKKAIVSFVERVTKNGSADFVAPAERIA